MPQALTSTTLLLTLLTSTPQTTPLPAYDVATIRPTKNSDGNVSVSTNNDIFQAENVCLRDLLHDAFGIQPQLILGIPPWAETARYDINAKVLDADRKQLSQLTLDQRRGMFLALYQKRFGLKWHEDTRPMPAYDLVVLKDGPKFKEADPHEAKEGTSRRNTDLTMSKQPIARLIEVLSSDVERPVVDKTGLSGKYDLHLKWSREEAPAAADSGKDDAPPSLYTALQEQLGLKLQPTKEPVRVIIIDGVTPPSLD